MSKMHLPIAEVPGSISETLRQVLSQHGYELVRVVDESSVEPLSPDERESVLREVGKNAAQALFLIDTNPENH
jgi:hypothetical protein